MGRSWNTTEQPADCHLAFLIEMEKRGIPSRMGKYIDEAPYRREIERLKAGAKSKACAHRTEPPAAVRL